MIKFLAGFALGAAAVVVASDIVVAVTEVDPGYADPKAWHRR